LKSDEHGGRGIRLTSDAFVRAGGKVEHPPAPAKELGAGAHFFWKLHPQRHRLQGRAVPSAEKGGISLFDELVVGHGPRTPPPHPKLAPVQLDPPQGPRCLGTRRPPPTGRERRASREQQKTRSAPDPQAPASFVPEPREPAKSPAASAPAD